MRAFWSYDTYPYVLSGEITSVLEGGRVKTKEYGNGYVFTPIVTLNDDEAIDIQKQLDTLKNEYEAAKKALHKEYMQKAKQVAKFIK